MPLRELLKKKDKIAETAQNSDIDSEKAPNNNNSPVPEFTFMRTTTSTQEIFEPPSYPGDELRSRAAPALTATKEQARKDQTHKSLVSRFRRTSHAPAPTATVATPEPSEKEPEPTALLSSPPKKDARRLSQRLHFNRKDRADGTSENIPLDLPAVPLAASNDEAVEAQWEKRATLLVQGPAQRSRSASVQSTRSRQSGDGKGSLDGAVDATGSPKAKPRPAHVRKISDAKGDHSIQEAIRLHDSDREGDLEKSTQMFGSLADPDGENNALAQVLYGLALRHGWGIEINPSSAITYLSLAAANSAAIEEEALASGIQKGGAAKGELTIAIYELANSFRAGWGVAKDPVAARQYYETAANLGDEDAMVEIAWCCVEGFGGPRDKWQAAQYLRQAERKGKKELGNSWIWKDKYDADRGKAKENKKAKK